MRRLLAVIVASCLPFQVVALSCMAPSVERSFALFETAEESYLIVHGRVTFDAKLMPRALSADQNPPETTRIPARLVGKSLISAGRGMPFENDVMLEVSCIGPWCGSIKDGEDLLAFVRKTATGYALAVTPCGGSAFGAPKPALIRKVKDCLREGSCKEE